MDQRLALLTKLEAAVRRGVECTQYLNTMRDQQDFIAKMEIKGQMNAAWADILLTLEELDELPASSPPLLPGEGPGVRE